MSKKKPTDFTQAEIDEVQAKAIAEADNDVIAAQVGRILGLSVLPVVTRGPYVVTPWIQKPNFIRASADAQTIIDKMSESEKTRETVGQYLLADPDRHGGNFLVDKEAGKIYDIDLDGSFKGNDAGGTVGTNAFVQMAYRTYGGKGPSRRTRMTGPRTGGINALRSTNQTGGRSWLNVRSDQKYKSEQSSEELHAVRCPRLHGEKRRSERSPGPSPNARQ